MIRVIILDDGYHSKDVVVNYGINFKKIGLTYFLNSLCFRHDSEYKVKTAHYEDLEADVEFFDLICDWPYNKVNINSVDFERLWESEDVVDGIDLY